MMRRVIVGCLLIAAVGVLVACGDDEPAQDIRGQAALAVGQFWQQELNGNVLPEGRNVIERGTQGIVELDSEDAQARVCVEYQYTVSVEPFDSVSRVYVATKSDNAWTFEVVHDNGTCEDVS